MALARGELRGVGDGVREAVGGQHPEPFDDLVAVSATTVVAGLAVYSLLGGLGYVWVAVALVLVAAGMRVVGVVAGYTVLNGLPANRTSIGAALVDTASEVTSAVGIALAGTILAALFTGSIAAPHWTGAQAAQFQEAVTISGLVLTVASASLVAWAILRMRRPADDRTPVDV